MVHVNRFVASEPPHNPVRKRWHRFKYMNSATIARIDFLRPVTTITTEIQYDSVGVQTVVERRV